MLCKQSWDGDKIESGEVKMAMEAVRMELGQE